MGKAGFIPEIEGPEEHYKECDAGSTPACAGHFATPCVIDANNPNGTSNLHCAIL
jgi:hypothetical protein